MKKPKKHVKSSPMPEDFRDLYESRLTIDPALQAELDEQGLEARWVNAIKLQRDQGFHHAGWRPYKRKKSATSGGDSIFGGDPEGYVRNGDLILAAKTVESADKQRRLLRHKANLYNDINKIKANELRQQTRSAGLDAKVFEGYEQNDGDDSDEE